MLANMSGIIDDVNPIPEKLVLVLDQIEAEGSAGFRIEYALRNQMSAWQEFSRFYTCKDRVCYETIENSGQDCP
ncbi:MAG: hypothetical protein GX850_01070 [Clostridiaceae bacterium]|nr:hypothetical protein [Clostridiaceae bacterium]